MADLDSQIGDARISHPIPLRLRNCMVDREEGGSKGYRGQGYTKARLRALYLGRYRSTSTGLEQGQVQLEIDHIDPYRMGGLTPHTNEQSNLRILDTTNNKFHDYAEGFQEKPVKRLRAF
jgi:hypothetical protein